MTERPAPFTIRPATAADLPAIFALLEAAELPRRGLADCIDTCFVAVSAAGEVVASAGIEPHGEVALLRSVVTREDVRGTRAGDAVVRAALDLARELGLTALYLFSARAQGFFARFGFVLKPHRAWPEAMRESSQWVAMDAWDPDNQQISGMALEPL